MVRLNLFTFASFSVGVLANSINLNSTTNSVSPTPCISVVTTVLFTQPTLCACPNNTVLNSLIQAENDVRDNVNELVSVLQADKVNLINLPEVVKVLEKSMAGLADLANGVLCIGPEFAGAFSGILQAIAHSISLVFEIASGQTVSSIQEIFTIVESIGTSVSGVLNVIQLVVKDKDMLACFGCQEIDSLNNMIFVLEQTAKEIFPGFGSLPRIPPCSGPTTSLITRSVACEAAPTPTAYDVEKVLEQCVRTYTVSAPPLEPSLCPCSEDQGLNGIITNIQNVINFAESILKAIPPLPGPLGILTSTILPDIIDGLTGLLNVIFGTGCFGSIVGPLITAFQNLIGRIISLISLLQQVSSNPSGVFDGIVSILTAVLNVANSVIHQLVAVITSDSLQCFACADIQAINSLIISVNNELAQLPAVSGIHLNTLPGCDAAAAASIVTSIVPCATAA